MPCAGARRHERADRPEPRCRLPREPPSGLRTRRHQRRRRAADRVPGDRGTDAEAAADDRQATDIAAYVKYAADRPGKDTGLLAAVGGGGVKPPAQEHDGKLAIAANPSGQLAYTVKAANATAGKITISMINMSGVGHNLAIQVGTGPTGKVLGATPVTTSGTHSITLNLPAGKYTFFCQVPGHRAAGMFGTLTVK